MSFTLLSPVRFSLARLARAHSLWIIFGVALIGCADNERNVIPELPVAVRVSTPVVTNLQEKLSYVGTVHARREIRLLARIPATVLSLPKSEGQTVATGEIIATLGAPELEASVERLRADRDYWCKHHEADERLVQAGALPQEQAKSSLRACKSARAALVEAEARLAKATERAPVDGRILTWFTEPGQNVLPGQPLLLLGTGDLELQVEVVESDLERGIDVGTAVQFRTRAGDLFHSEVVDVAPAASGRSRTFTVKAGLPAELSRTVRVGSSLRVDFILDSCSQCIAVPIEAIHHDGEHAYVFRIRDGRSFREAVTPGITEAGFTQISMPWNGTDLVAVSNLAGLADSVRVFPVQTTAATP